MNNRRERRPDMISDARAGQEFSGRQIATLPTPICGYITMWQATHIKGYVSTNRDSNVCIVMTTKRPRMRRKTVRVSI